MNVDAATKLSKRAIAQIVMLSAQFLLGMAVNLIGLPEGTSGASRLATTIFLVLHIGIGLGLLIGSLLAVRLARAVGPHFVRDAWIGVLIVAGTFVSGLLAWILNSSWWSYGMAVGFLASFLLYGAMFVYVGREGKSRRS